MKKLNLLGHRGDHFEVISEHAGIRYGKSPLQSAWVCRCDCGKTFVVTTNRLRREGNVKSCGCLNFTKAHANASKPPQEVTWQKHHYGYKYRAKRKGRAWRLSKKRFREMCQAACHYCGSLPLTPINAYMTGDGKPRSRNEARCAAAEILVNGIDRVNSNAGYTNANCVPACKTCNFAKSDMSYGLFVEWLERVASFREQQNLCE